MNVSGFQSLFNEQNETINNLVIVGTIDLSQATIIGFPTDNITTDFNGDNKLEVKDDGISTQKIQDGAVTDSKIDSMDASKLFGTVTVDVNNVNTTTQNLTLTNKLTLPDGSETDPSLTFTLDQDTGLYRPSSNNVTITLGGNDSYSFGTSSMTSNGNILGVNGSNTSPTYSFSSDPNTGMYSFAPDQLGFSTAGATKFVIDGTESTLQTSLNCVNINCQSVSAGTHSITCGDITSTGTFDNGTHDMLTGNIQCTSITVPGGGNFDEFALNTATAPIYTTDIFCTNATVTGTLSITGSVSVGAITSSGPFTNGTNSLTTGAITSSGTFSNGTNSLVTGAITSSGAFTNGTNTLSCGNVTCRTINAGTNSVTCGAITSSGTFSNGTNSLTCGAITSSGTFSNGTNSLTCGAITSSGTFSNGTNSMTTGNITSGSMNAGTNSATIGNLNISGEVLCSNSKGSFIVNTPIAVKGGNQFISQNMYYGGSPAATRCLAATGGSYASFIKIDSGGGWQFFRSTGAAAATDDIMTFNPCLIFDVSSNATFSNRILCQQGYPLCTFGSYGLGSTLTNTTIEINIMGLAISGFIPANSLRVGSIIKIYVSSLIGFVASNTIRLRVYLNTTVIADTGNFGPSVGVTGDMFIAECEGNFRSIGASGSIVLAGRGRNLAGTVQTNFNTSFTPVTIDTTINNSLSMTLQFSAASLSNSWVTQVYDMYMT